MSLKQLWSIQIEGWMFSDYCCHLSQSCFFPPFSLSPLASLPLCCSWFFFLLQII